MPHLNIIHLITEARDVMHLLGDQAAARHHGLAVKI